MLLVKNMVLREADTGLHYRLLDEVASRETKDTAPTHFVVIDIHHKRAVPEFFGKLKTFERIADREFSVVSEPFETVNLDSMTAGEARVVERRWKLYEMLKVHGDRLYDSGFRGAEADRLAALRIASKPFFYATLRLYWQRGGGKSSLATNYCNCGRPGQRRVALVDAPKPGRPRTIQPGTGVSATQFHRANMRIAWSRSPVGRDGRGLRSAWTWMLIARYPEHVALSPAVKANGKPALALKNFDAVPSFEQFRYHWQAEHSFEQRQLSRLQQRRFDLAFKPLLTGTLQEVRGPGTRYYIDATVLDVYCVSRLNRSRIVGRPTLYVVVDQFSRMVVGIYVGLEPPCWEGAMLALWNCCVDKVAFCAGYGIEITTEQWPTGHIPLHLMADRGEVKSEQADALVMGFGLDVENSRPYAGEAKGVAERAFNTLQAKFGPYMPGYVDKEFSGRGSEPAALRATMGIHEITRVMIAATLHTNLRVVREYEGWPEVVAAGVPFVPLALWQWGVENLRSDCRRFEDSHLKRYLWPQSTMKLTRKALHFFRGLYYMGVQLGAQQWFAKAFQARDSLPVLYHPSHIGSAIVVPPGERTATFNVELTRRSALFGDVALSEVMALGHHSKQTNAEASWQNLPMQARYEGVIHETVRESRRKAAEDADASLSKNKRLKDIRANHADEINLLTSDAMSGTIGFDPTGRTIDVAATEVTPQAEETVDAVSRLIEARRGSTQIS